MLLYFLAALESDADRQAFQALYARYHERLERTAMRILKDQRDVEDALQNAFVQVVRHFEKISEIPCEELPFWLVSIVKNESLTILRKRRGDVPLEDWDGVERDADEAVSYRHLVELFRRLPEGYRAVLEMKLLSGYSDKEIAQRLGITETAVSTRASRGRVMLQKIVEKEGYHP